MTRRKRPGPTRSSSRTGGRRGGGLLERRGAARDAAVLLGAVRSPHAGHRVFGADEATLAALGERLRAQLGEEAFAGASAEGAALDGDAVVEVALRAL